MAKRVPATAATGIVVSALMVWASAGAASSRELDAVLARVANPDRGKVLYETCAACHGPEGQGIADGTVPAIAGQRFLVIARQLVDFRRGVRIDSRMQHFADTTHLSYSQEVADVAAYISQLTPRNAPDPAIAVDNRAALTYARKCEHCHGPTAEGSESGFAPRLAGQHAEYLLRQLTKDPATRPSLKEAHAGVMDGLSRDELSAIARNLSTS